MVTHRARENGSCCLLVNGCCDYSVIHIPYIEGTVQGGTIWVRVTPLAKLRAFLSDR